MKAGDEKKAALAQEETLTPVESETSEETLSKSSSNPDSPDMSPPPKESSEDGKALPSNPGQESVSSGSTREAEKASQASDQSSSQKKSKKKKTTTKVEEKEEVKKVGGRATKAAETGEPGPSSQVNIDEAIKFARLRVEAMELKSGVRIHAYTGEEEMEAIMGLISKDLSEPYSIFTYRFFIHNWPHLCYIARVIETGEAVGAVVCKLDDDGRGYIAMLAVDESQRRKGIGSRLVAEAITSMKKCGCKEVALETEVTNTASLRLYHDLGFVRDKRLFRYYLNGVDAYRLKLWLIPPELPPVTCRFLNFQHLHHRAC